MRSIGPRSLIYHCTFTLALVLVTALPLGALAQQAAPELPQPSPKARVEQRVGLTNFSVDYSSPGVKGRMIWGQVVPWDKPWRTGANAPTTLTASRDFKFGGKTIPAGSYALYTVPGKVSWVIALSSSLDASGNDYDAKKDVARITLKPQTIRGRERLTFLFNATSDSTSTLDIEWEKVRLSVPLEVDTKAQTLANIDKAVEDTWRPHFVSARYLLDNGGDMDKALGYIDQSIAIKATWWNHWVRAQILDKKGRTQDAVATAEKAVQLGSGDRAFESFFKADVTSSLAGWKKKL